MVLLSAQAMEVPMIAKVTFTSEDRVRDVIRNFNTDGFDSLYPRYAGGRPPTFTGSTPRNVDGGPQYCGAVSLSRLRQGSECCRATGPPCRPECPY
jgi:hypothetical protein